MSRRPSMPDFTGVNLPPNATSFAKIGWKTYPKQVFSTFASCFDTTIMFEASGSTIFSNSDIHSVELTEVVKDIDSRDRVIQRGITLQGSHFDIFQFHNTPSLLLWGRNRMKEGSKGVPDTGIALCRVSSPEATSVEDLYILITYKLPIVSAFAVNRLQAFKLMLEGSVVVDNF